MFKSFLILVSVALWPAILFADEGVGETRSDDADLTGQVYDRLADFMIACDDFAEARSNRMYFVATEDSTRIDPKRGVSKNGRYFVYANEPSVEKRLIASAVNIQTRSELGEVWTQEFTDKAAKLYRHGIPTFGNRSPDIEITDKTSDKQKGRLKTLVFQPMLSSITMAHTIGSNVDKRGMLNTFLKAELLSGRFDKGDIVATFRLFDGNIEPEYEIRFGKEQKYFPVEFKMRRKWKSDEKFLIMATKTQWSKQGDWFLPDQIEGVTFHHSGAETHRQLLIMYLPDAQFPPRPVLDEKIVDWREPIRLLFDMEWKGHKSIFTENRK